MLVCLAHSHPYDDEAAQGQYRAVDGPSSVARDVTTGSSDVTLPHTTAHYWLIHGSHTYMSGIGTRSSQYSVRVDVCLILVNVFCVLLFIGYTLNDLADLFELCSRFYELLHPYFRLIT